jgi:hypothetical protein
MPCPARLFSAALTIGSTWYGLVVGTKLGTVVTALSERNNILQASRFALAATRTLRLMLWADEGGKKGGLVGFGLVH